MSINVLGIATPHTTTEDHDAEFAVVVEELQRAGFVTIGTAAEDNES